MKNIILILFAINALSINCQTYISPFYGYGSSYIYPTYNFDTIGLFGLSGYNPYLYYMLRENNREYFSPVYFYENQLFGLKINQNIGTRFEIDFES